MSCFRKCRDFTNVQAETDRLFEIKRIPTDVPFLDTMAIFMLVFLGLLLYCIYHGDIARIINGHDSCGNICGEKNSIKFDENANCSSRDHRKNRFLIIVGETHNLTKLCVPDCGQFGCRAMQRTCISKNNSIADNEPEIFLEGRIGSLHIYLREIIFICLIALALSIAVLLMLRFFPALTVWFILITTTVTLSILTYQCWKRWDLTRNPVWRALGICYLIGAAVVSLLVVRMRIHIQLVIQLFRESGIVLTSMPMLLFKPLLTFSCMATIFCTWIYFALWIESSGKLTMKAPNIYHYEKDTFMLITRWYNIIVAFWMIQFTISCQHVIIAGAVSAWYFTRDKNTLKCPVCISSYNLIRYHLGSVAKGSFIMTLMEVIYIFLLIMKASISAAERSHKLKHFFELLEKVLKFLEGNVYVEIALRGYSFLDACKRTLKITKEHISEVLTISTVADIVIWCGQFLVAICALIIGFMQGMECLPDVAIQMILMLMFAFFTAKCFTSGYKMTVDTLLVCFCEDRETNDGVLTPYYMSRGINEFVKVSHRILAPMDSLSKESDSYIQETIEFLFDTIFHEDQLENSIHHSER